MDVFEKALRYLYERQLEKLGVTANIIITKEPAEKREDKNEKSAAS